MDLSGFAVSTWISSLLASLAPLSVGASVLLPAGATDPPGIEPVSVVVGAAE